MRRMAGVGDKMSSFQTCDISARRCAASSGVSVVFSSTALASARRPFMTSHRDDSGMANTMNASRTDGAAPMPSMTRQPR
jgi:hypothetical protein